MGKRRIDRINEINYNNKGIEMKIIQYDNCDNIIVEFQDEYKAKVHTGYYHFKHGNVTNPYHRNVCDVGFIGKGQYSYKTHKEIYNIWKHMLERCYNPYYINDNLTYKDCFVCEEWHNFQIFARWYEDNYYEIKGEKMCLDKDILYKGNKIYSPNNCVIVPNRINVLFVKSDKSRGDYPIGCSYSKEKDKIEVHCQRCSKKRKFLGYYNTIDEAFNSYKNFKESYIKQVADEYKDLIPQKLYEAMYNYEVEIND